MTRVPKARAQRLAVRVDSLDNGVRVVTVPRPGLSRTHVYAQLRGGPVHEDDATWGMSHLVEHMVFRGTDRHPDVQSLTLAADALGGDLGAATWRDRVAFDTRVDVDRIGDAFALMASMITAPRFNQLALERGIVEEEISDLFDDDGNDVDPENAVFAHLFAGHPLARSIEGRPEVLHTFGPRAVRAWHARAYVGANLVVSVAGPVQHARVLAAAKKALKRVKPGAALPLGSAPSVAGARKKRAASSRVHVLHTESPQTAVRLCAPLPGFGKHAARPADVAAAHMLARLLDDGPASRLQARIVDRDGLAYSVWAMADLYEDKGCLELGASVRPEGAVDIVRSLRRELLALAHKQPEKDELARVCARAERDDRDVRDDPAALAESAGKAVLFGTPFQPERELALLRAVAPVDVQRCARAALDEARFVLSGTVPRKAATLARSYM